MYSKKVLVSVPVGPQFPYIHKWVSRQVLKMFLNNHGHRLHYIDPVHNPYENNLNHIVKDFINNDFDFWLNIDNDNPPIKNPLELLDYNRDIIGLPTPVWHFKNLPKERPIYWNGYDYIPEKGAYKEHEPKQGLQKVDAIGTGCFLIAKRVFLHPEMQKGAFLRTYNEDGTVERGNDISFCEKARKYGFEIYCHYDYPCMHFCELELGEVIKAIQNLI